VSAAAALEDFLAQSRGLVEPALDGWLPTEAQAGPLAAAMRHIACAGGKRLRPALVLLGNRHVGGRPEQALGAAVAVELVHAYSLVHDDLPCMDDAQLRRGRPCVHVLWGEGMAVLAGDGLLTLAFEVLAAHTPRECPVGTMVAALGEAAGWAGMVGGQVEDLAAEGQAPELERVRRIHLGKTAAMMGVSLRLGALSGGASAADAKALAGVGRDFGLAFQIVDDLLDVQGTTAELGKAAGADAERAKMTWPAVAGVERSWRDARQLVAGALAGAPPGACGPLLEALGATIVPRRS